MHQYAPVLASIHNATVSFQLLFIPLSYLYRLQAREKPKEVKEAKERPPKEKADHLARAGAQE